MKFKSDIELQAGLRDGSNDIGTAGQILSSTGSQTNWIDPEAKLVVIECKNTSGSAISKGTPVYQTGTVGATDVIEVGVADASDEDKMAAIGLLQTDLANNAFGKVVITGELLNITTSPIDGVTPVTGDTIYVKSGGGLTLTKPTGVNFIQNIGLVGKVSGGSAGSITVSSIMRSNDVPTPLYIDHTNQRLGIGVESPARTLQVNSGGANIVATFESSDTLSRISFVDSNTSSDAVVQIGADGNELVLFAGGAEHVRVDSTGNVGIGTPNPSNFGFLEKVLNISAGSSSSTTLQQAGLVISGSSDSDDADDFGYLSFTNYQSTLSSDRVAEIRINKSGSNVNTGRFNFYTANGTALNESMVLGETGLLKLSQYGAGTLVSDASGNITVSSGGGAGGPYLPLSAGSGKGLTGQLWFTGTTDANRKIFFTNAGTYAKGSMDAASYGFQVSGSEKLTILPSGNVGIGTTSPNSKLEVNVGTDQNVAINSYNSVARISSYNDAFTASEPLIINGSDLRFDISGSEKMRISANGNVGIGTTTPSEKLEVDGRIKLQTSAGSLTMKESGAGSVALASSATIVMEAPSNFRLKTGSSLLENFTVLSTGNVGIGTASPASKFEVYGGNSGVNDVDRYVRFKASNGEKRFDFYVGGTGNESILGMYTYDGTTKNVQISSSGTSYFNGGNVGIGTTSPGAKLDVEGRVDFSNDLRLRGTDSSANQGVSRFYVDSSNKLFIDTANNGSNLFVIDSSGNVGIGTPSPGYKLDVSGSARFTGDITVGNTAGSQINMLRTSANYINATNNTGYLVFRTGGYDTALTLDASQNATFAGDLTVSGGDITLGGTGRIQGVDTVSASTDAVNKAYVDNAIAGTPQMVKFDRSGINSSTYTMLATVNGDRLASILKMTMTGTSSGVVFACTFDITVNHHKDIHVKSSNGDFTEVTLRITSNDNEDFSIEAKHNGGTTTTAEVCIYPLANEIITPTTTDPGYTGAEYEHTATEGWRYGGEDNNVESSNVIVDGNVGIGTTTPSTKLEVAASATTSVDIAHFSNSNGVVKINHSLDGVGAGKISILDSSNNEDIRLSAQGDSWFNAGNVGIGTTSPSQLLDADGDGLIQGKLTVGNSSYYDEAGVLNVYGSGKNQLTIQTSDNSLDRGVAFRNSGGAHVAYIAATNATSNLADLVFGVSDATETNVDNVEERMRITSAGNVGIGTTTPGHKLEVYATGDSLSIGDNSNTQTYMRFANSRTMVGYGGANAVIQAGSGKGINFNVNNDSFNSGTAATITSTGNVGIGTTSPRNKLDIALTSAEMVYPAATGTSPTGGFRIGHTNTTWAGVELNMGIANASAQGYPAWIQAQNPADLSDSRNLLLNPNGGNVGIGTNSPSAKLEVNGQTVINSTGLTEGFQWFNDTNEIFSLEDTSGAGELLLLSSNSVKVKLNANGNSYFNGGNVGIGTTSPGKKLHVVGDTYIEESGTGQTLLLGRTNGQPTIKADNSNGGHMIIDSYSNFMSLNHYISQNVVLVAGGGNVGIGTTSPGYKLDVSGDARFTGDVTVSGGDITLGGTGRIQGIDTVSAGTDATSKTYVDNAIAGVPQGDITAVTAGTFLTGGGTSGSVTLNADASKLAHIHDSSSGSAAAGWITVAQASGARKAGEIYVTDGDSGDHSYIRIEWMRSYQDSNFTVLNCGGHANRITGVRVLQETGDPTYGKKYIQVKVTATSTYYVIVTAPGTIPAYGDLTAETPVLENTKTGYTVKGNTLEDLQNSSVGSEQGITSGGDLFVNGGDIVLGGTGRIQGVDTVSASTDAVNKAYVDTSLGNYLPVNNPTFTGTLTGPSATITGNTLLGNSNGDYVHVNDRLFVGATDSGNAEFWFGEGTTGDVNYGAHWHWDSGYTHKWFTVNNSSETLMMDYATNDTSKVNWHRDIDIQDNDIVIDSSHGFVNSGAWTRISNPYGNIEFGPANATWAHIYTDRPNFYFNKELYVNNKRVYNTGYHPEADKWTTARTLTLTGYATGSVSWDGSGNASMTTAVAKIKAGGNGPSNENLNSVADSVSVGQLEYRGFNSSSTNKPPTSDNANGVITVGQHSGNYNAQLAFSSNGNMYWRDNPSTSYGSWRTMWDSGNDGAGSGLDADLLDGQQGSYYATAASLGNYLLDTTDTFTGSLIINGDIRGNGQQLILNAGESGSYATGQTSEYVFVNSENGLIVNSSPDNWSSGWAGRNTTYINKADGTSSFTGKISVQGSNVIEIDQGYSYLNHLKLLSTFGSKLFSATNYGYVLEYSSTPADPVTFRFDNDRYRIYSGSSGEALTVLANTKVGINNTNPTYQLHVSGNAGFTGQTTHSSGLVTSSSQTRNKISVWSSLSSYTIGMKSGFGYGGLGGDSTGTNYAMSFQMSNTNDRGWWWGDTSHSDVQGSMSLTTDGELVVAKSLSVGAGETTRTAADRPLEVTGNALIDGRLTIEGPAPIATSPMLELHRTSPVVDYKDLNSAGYFSLKERFLNSGSTVIGSREVSQNPGGSGIYHNFDNGASGGSQFHQRQNSFHWKINSTSEKLTLGTNGYIGINDTSPSYQLDVNGSGRFTSTVTATNFILSSDERLKENVKKVCDNRVKADWKTFELKTDKGQKRYGVIAQELEKTNPEFVREDSKGFKSVAYIDLLIAKIAELEARLEKLEK